MTGLVGRDHGFRAPPGHQRLHDATLAILGSSLECALVPFVPPVVSRMDFPVPVHAYPTSAHAAAAASIVEFFAAREETGTVLLVNSCARGRATPDSDLDMVVFVAPGMDMAALNDAWEAFRRHDPRIAAYLASGPFAVLHLDIEGGVIAPPEHAADEYPDGFDLAIGNWFVWGAPLWERDTTYRTLRAAWLPFYDDQLRLARLRQVRTQCVEYLALIPSYAARGEYFQAHARLWRSFHLFMQALFLHRRQYPIAYDKWIREQVVEHLGLPALYDELPGLFEIGRFESDEVARKATVLQRLLDEYVPGEE